MSKQKRTKTDFSSGILNRLFEIQTKNENVSDKNVNLIILLSERKKERKKKLFNNKTQFKSI